jgi:hypothetical protein
VKLSSRERLDAGRLNLPLATTTVEGLGHAVNARRAIRCRSAEEFDPGAESDA